MEHGTRLWSLICLEMWYRTWIDSDSNKRLGDGDNPFAGFSRADGTLPVAGDGQAIMPELMVD